MIIAKSQKMKIKMNNHNKAIFFLYCDYGRYLWNIAIQESNYRYKIYKDKRDNLNLSKKELRKFYPNAKNLRNFVSKNEWESQFPYETRDVIFEKLDKAWKNAFNPNMPNHKRPKFKTKKKDLKTSFTFRKGTIKNGYYYPQTARGNKSNKFSGIKLSEEIKLKGKIAIDSTISFDGKDWWISFTSTDKEFEPINYSKELKTGVDVNIGKFNYKDEDETYQELNILTDDLMKNYEKIKFFSKQLSKKTKNSNNYWKARTKLNNIYNKTVRKQDDCLNKFVYYLLSTFKSITIEDLDVNSMKMNKRISKKLHRSLFGKFKTKILKKQNEFNSVVILANRFYPSTQRCSNCGFVKTGEDKITLSGDKHGNGHYNYVCYNCDSHLHRDENAVENLIDYNEELFNLIQELFY